MTAFVRPEKTARVDESIDEPGICLPERQIRAYNASDLLRFCACFSDEVQVFDNEGKLLREGMAAFRDFYARTFSSFENVHGDIVSRKVEGAVTTDLEQWSRDRRSFPVQHVYGLVRVKYTEREGSIARVQFEHIRPPTVGECEANPGVLQ